MVERLRGSVAAVYRYPVKGLTAEPLARVALTAGQTLPFDRAYAIENGPGPFDPAAPAHLPKIHFVMLMRNEQLARLRSRFDEASHTLTLTQGGQVAAQGRLDETAGRKTIEDFISRFMPEALRGAPRVVVAPGHSFSDVKDKCLHVVNLESVRALETAMGKPVDPLCFRPNVVIEGIPAFSELDWIGKTISVGGAGLQVFKRTQRCAATNVDPRTGERDLELPSYLSRTLGHTDFGFYARVTQPGEISAGQPFSIA